MKSKLQKRYDVKKPLNKIFDRVFGFHLVSGRRVGISLFSEIRRTGTYIDVVFDVGANVGSSSLEYLREFPDAVIHAFEPVSSNFTILNTITSNRLRCNRTAIGSEIREIKIFLSVNATRHSSIVVEDKGLFESVNQLTIDSYCKDYGIEHIGLLKIDTEGADLSVLRGAEGLLRKRAIDFLFVEVSFYVEQRHVLISEFISYLAPYGYFVMGVYDQSLEWDGRARVQYANVLFARSGLTASSEDI